jgi:thioredoxin reductase (NADPH)
MRVSCARSRARSPWCCRKPARSPPTSERAARLGIEVLAPADSIELVRDGASKIRACRFSWADSQREFDTVYPVLGADIKGHLASAIGARRDDDGELIVDARMQTSVDGCYAAGDAVSAVNQIAVAVGHAAIAAIAIHNRLPRNAR